MIKKKLLTAAILLVGQLVLIAPALASDEVTRPDSPNLTAMPGSDIKTATPIKAQSVSTDEKPSSGPGESVHQPASPVETGDLLQVVQNPRVSLILAGGGARGAAHVGVLKVFEAEKIPIDLLVGSSVGSMVGCLYCAGVPTAKIEELVLSSQFKKAFYPLPIKVKAALTVPPYLFKRMLLIKPPIGLYSGNAIAKFVSRNLPSGITNIEQLKIPYAALAVNLKDTRPVFIDNGPINKAVQASCSVPFLFRPVAIGDNLLVDGGLRSNLPTEAANSVGARLVIAVKLHSFLKTEAKKLNTVVSYGDQLAGILMSEIEDKPAGQADIVIEPNADNLNLHNFNRADLAAAIESGEAATRKALPAIKAKLSRLANSNVIETK